MNFDLAFFISVAAVIVMLYCLGRVASLKGEMPGGMIGKQWGILQFLVIIFSIGYFAVPFAGLLPDALLHTIVSIIFLFGTAYVLFTIKLIHNIIKVFKNINL